MFTGYHYGYDPALAVAAIVSNGARFQSHVGSTTFSTAYFNVKPPLVNDFAYVQRVGASAAMTQSDELILRQMLKERKPVQALIGKAVKLIREMADRPAARGTIGKQLNAVILPRNPGEAARAEYHSAINSYKAFMPDLVVARSDERMMSMGVEVAIRPVPGAPPLVVGEAGRNAPCPCKSGKKYKYCHGDPKRR